MGSLGSPKPWEPTYFNSKDCSQGFCSVYCPKWCYIIYPPPPPLDFPEGNSSPNFSPLVVAIIGILVSAFLLVSYYTIISKYCGNTTDHGRRSSREDDYDENPEGEFEDNHNPSIHEAWHVATAGLEEALIKSITVCKYKKGDGLVEGTDCSVCLSEFQEDEEVRLLPKCSHAFHIQCIDTWLRSHSNCPLCRANVVVCVNPPTATESTTFSSNESTAANDDQNRSFVGQDRNSESVEETDQHSNTNDVVVVPKSTTASSLRAFSDLGNLEERHSVIDIRRSVSMDHSGRDRVLVADILRMNHGDEEEGDHVTHVHVEGCSTERASCSKLGQVGKDNGNRKGILHCVMSPVAMKRSVSSGRFFLTRPSGYGRERHNVIPL